MKLEKGQIVNLTSGEYSDFGIVDTILVLEPFDTNDRIRLFMVDQPDDYLGTRQTAFIASLVRDGLVKSIGDSVTEWHLGSYGSLEEE